MKDTALSQYFVRGGRLILAALLTISLSVPLGLNAPPTVASAAPSNHYKVEFYADAIMLASSQALKTYPNVPEGTAIIDPGVATPTFTTNPYTRFIGWYVYNPTSPPPDSEPYDFNQPLMGDLTLVARYNNDILVTFLDGYGKAFLTRHANPDDPKESVTLPSASEMQAFTAPSGYHFESWQLDGATYTGAHLLSDTTIEPKLSTGSAFVFFVSAGSQVPFETVDKGGFAHAPANPTRDGYTFLRWSTTDGGSTAFDFAKTAITGDTTLYAVWQANTVNYTVLFWQEKPNIPGDAGTDPANYQPFYQFTKTAVAGSPTANINVTALVAGQAAANKPPYSTYAAGNFTVNTTTVAGNGSTVVNVYFKRIEYTFVVTLNRADAKMVIGNTTYTDATTKYQFKAKVEQDISQLWPANIGTVTATNTTYHLQGWLTPGDNVPTASKVLALPRDMLPASGTTQQLTGTWLASGKNVTLHYMFESLEGNVSGAVAYNNKYYLPSPDYTQTLFSGGSVPFNLKLIEGMTGLTKSALGKQGNNYVAITTSAVDQYLFYDRNVHRIDFNANGGTVYLNNGLDYTKVRFGEDLTPYAPSPPLKNPGDGLTYTFEGWYLDPGFYTPFDFATTMGNGDLMLFAKWSVSEYTVTIYDDLTVHAPLDTLERAQGEYVGDPGRYTPGQNVPGRGVFLGWVVFVGPGATAPLSFDMPVTSDMAVHASWEAETYTVTYTGTGAASGAPPTDSGSYTMDTEARVKDQGTLVAPSGQHFIGWQVSGASASAPPHYPGTLITVTGNLTLNPVFAGTQPVLTKITYKANYPSDMGGTEPEPIAQYATPGTTLTIASFDIFGVSIPNPNYSFICWVDASNPQGTRYVDGASITVPTTDITLIGLWTQPPKQHVVSFDAGVAGSFASGATTQFTVVEGQPLYSAGGPNQVVPPVPAYDDAEYTFLGWSPNYSDDSVIYADRTYVAQYALIPPKQPLPNVPLGSAAGEVYLDNVTTVYDGKGHSAIITNGGIKGEKPLPGLQILHDDLYDHIINWEPGNPVYTDVGDHGISFAFAATGYNPSAQFGYVKITPRPLTVKATHPDIPYTSPVPDCSEYTVLVENLVAGESFNPNQLTLSTNYSEGDPVGPYYILADPGYFGNYQLGDPSSNTKVVVGRFNVYDVGADGALELSKAPATGQPLIVKKGDEVTYTITIKNVGKGRLFATVIEEEMKGVWSNALGFDLEAAWQQGDNSLLIDYIEPGVSLKVNYTVVAGEGTLVNTVRGEGSGGGPADATDSSIKGGVLEMSKKPAAGQPLVVKVDEEVTYTITIANLSSTASLSDVLVKEDRTGGTWSNAKGFTLPGANASGKLTAASFTIPTVDPGAVWTVDYTVAAGKGTNINTVSAADNGGNGDNTDTGTDGSINGGILDVKKALANEQDPTVFKGDKVTYTITIRNLGKDPADKLSDVVVTESTSGGTWSNAKGFTLPGANASGELVADSFTIPTVDFGAVWTVDYTVTAAEGTLTNTVVVKDGGGTGTGDNGDTDTNTDLWANVLTLTKTPAAGQPTPGLKKGDEVAYTITITNTGSTNLLDVLIFEGRDGTWSNPSAGIDLANANGWTLSIPVLAAGATLNVDYTVVAEGGPLVNMIGAADDGGYGPNTAIAIDYSVYAGVLYIDKAPAADQSVPVKKGDDVTYTITIHNVGSANPRAPVDLQGVRVTEQMGGGTWSNAQGFTLQGADGDGRLKEDSFTIPLIPDGAQWTIDYTVAAGEGRLSNSVTAANWNNTDTDTANDASITGGVLTVKKVLPAWQPRVVKEGDEVTYTISIHNSSDTLDVDNVAVVESMAGKWSNPVGFPAGFDLAASRLSDGSLLIPTVPAGDTLYVDYTVEAGLGTLTNTVIIADGGGGGGDTDISTNTDIWANILSIEKAPAAEQKPLVKTGDEVTYTITIRNRGTNPTDVLNNVVVTEDMTGGTWSNPTGGLVLGGQASQINGNTLTIASMPAGAIYTVDYKVKATEGTLTNTVRAQDGGGNGDNGDTGTNTSITAGILDVSKAPAAGQALTVKKGDAITYTITIKNLSSKGTTLTNVLVEESMKGGTWSNPTGGLVLGGQASQINGNKLTIASMPAGATYTVDYRVAADEGTNVNTVTATGDGGGNTDTGTDDNINGGILDVSKAPAAKQPLVVEVGDKVTYTITIKNLSLLTPLNDVSVTESMKGGTWSNASGFALPGANSSGELKANSFTLAAVDAGAVWTVDYTVTATEGTNINTVHVAGTGGGGGGNTDTGTDDSINGGILDVSKAPAAGQELVVEVGEDVTYTITIRNLGKDPVNDVLSDVLIEEGTAGGTWSDASGFALPGANSSGELKANSFVIPTVAAGATLTVDYTVAATEGTNINTVSAAGTGGGGGGGNTDTGTDDSINGGILDVSKAPAAGQPLTVKAGDPVTYTITIRNLGTDPFKHVSSDVLVTDSMSGGTWSNAKNFTLPGAEADGTLAGQSFTIPSITPGATLAVDYTVNATESTVKNTVTIKDESGNGGNGDTDTDTDITGGVLSVTKIPRAGQALVVQKGDKVAYTISIHNDGATYVATDVVVVESMPGAWSNANFDLATAKQSDGNLLIARVEPGATLTVDYTVVADVGTITNSVKVANDGGDGDDTSTSTNVDVFAGSLTVSKAPAAGQPTSVKTGDTVVYTITLHNIGTAALSNVLVAESMAGTWSNAAGFDLAAARQSNGSLLIGSIGAGATLTVDYTVMASKGTLSNTVTALDGSGKNGDTVTNTSVTATGDRPSPVPPTGDSTGLLLALLAAWLLVCGLACFISARRRPSSRG